MEEGNRAVPGEKHTAINCQLLSEPPHIGIITQPKAIPCKNPLYKVLLRQ